MTRRLSEARVVLAGNMNGLAAEIAKNAVLAGLGSCEIIDDQPAAHAATENFLVTVEDRQSASDNRYSPNCVPKAFH